MPVETFAALADPTRRHIVELLAERELAAGEIAKQFDVTGPAISRHLRLLRQSGVVRYRRDGQRRVYALEPEPLREVDDWLTRNLEVWRRRFVALGDHLDDMAAATRRPKEDEQ